MSDKERLQRLKRLNNLSNVWEYLEQTTLYDGNALKESWEWLIKRVEELEKEVSDWRAEVQKWQRFYKESEESHLETKELLHSTISENKRYKQALEFYADEERYKEKLISEAQCDADGIWISNDVYVPAIIYFDGGEKARQALESDEN